MQKQIVRRRVAPSAQTGAATPQTTQVTRTGRKLRMTSNRLDREEELKQRVVDDLKSISEVEEQIDALTEQLNVLHARVETSMRDARLSTVEGSTKIAEMRESFSRQSITIDPRKYRNKVTQADFWASIEVSVTAARKIMAEKELLGISDVVPAKSLGTRLSVKDKKRGR